LQKVKKPENLKTKSEDLAQIEIEKKKLRLPKVLMLYTVPTSVQVESYAVGGLGGFVCRSRNAGGRRNNSPANMPARIPIK